MTMTRKITIKITITMTMKMTMTRKITIKITIKMTMKMTMPMTIIVRFQMIDYHLNKQNYVFFLHFPWTYLEELKALTVYMKI